MPIGGRWAVAAAGVVALALAGCGSSSSSSSSSSAAAPASSRTTSAATTSTTRTTSTTGSVLGISTTNTAPSAGGGGSTSTSSSVTSTSARGHRHGRRGNPGGSLPFTDGPAPQPPALTYQHTCDRLDKVLGRAQIDYQPNLSLKLGQSATVKAGVTINMTVSPAQVLGTTGAIGVPGQAVSCTLQAQLSAAPSEFDLTPTGWQPRSLLSADTATWDWLVTPKVGGTHTIVLYLRPIASLSYGRTTPVAAASAVVQQYEMTAHVSVPWFKSLADTLGVAENLVKGLTGLLTALVALAGVFGLRTVRRKRARAAPAETQGGQEGGA